MRPSKVSLSRLVGARQGTYPRCSPSRYGARSPASFGILFFGQGPGLRVRPHSIGLVKGFSTLSYLRQRAGHSDPRSASRIPDYPWPSTISPDQELAYERLRPVVDSLPGKINWAVAYGSGVRHQANSDPKGTPPMMDLLISVPSTEEFHAENLRANPTHYPVIARWLGAERVARINDEWGAGVWYVTMVNMLGLQVKYGVISLDRLKRDLKYWDTLYVAGRLHKPEDQLITQTLTLVEDSTLAADLTANLTGALCVALLTLPSRFTEDQLWEAIAGLSYSGDPRMNVPGAENPGKVKNIVKGEGARAAFRKLYGPIMPPRVEWDRNPRVAQHREGGDFEWKGDGEALLERPSEDAYLAKLASQLPPWLSMGTFGHYHLEGLDRDAHKSFRADADGSNVNQWLAIISGQASRRQNMPSDPNLRHNGAVGVPRHHSEGFAPLNLDWRGVMMFQLGQIIRKPALRQTLKGLFTAGLRKSLSYSLAKFGKWWRARRG